MTIQFFQDTDNMIIEGILKGDKEKYLCENKLYQKYRYFIDEGIKKYHLEIDESATVYSDSIITIINHILTNRFERKSSIKTYLHQIFHNQCVSYIRKKTTNKASSMYDTVLLTEILYPLSDPTKSIIHSIIEREDENLLLEKLKKIGEKCKELLLLWADGFSDKEILSKLPYQTVDVVKVSRMRCINKLREIYR